MIERVRRPQPVPDIWTARERSLASLETIISNLEEQLKRSDLSPITKERLSRTLERYKSFRRATVRAIRREVSKGIKPPAEQPKPKLNILPLVLIYALSKGLH